MQLAKDTCERQRGEHAGLVHEAVYGGAIKFLGHRQISLMYCSVSICRILMLSALPKQHRHAPCIKPYKYKRAGCRSVQKGNVS